MKTHKSILKKINEWEGNAMMVAGVYRLFTYLPWDQVPEKYKSFFPEEAKEKWDDDLGKYNEEELKLDIEAEIRALLNVLAKKNITNALGVVPMILADVFVIGKPTGALQGKLLKVITTYKDILELDRTLAEQLTMFEIFDIVETIVKKASLKLSFDLQTAIEQVKTAALKVDESNTNIVTPKVNAQIEQALQKEKQQKVN